MKLSIRTLDQKTITVEMNPKENVLQLKKHLVSLPQINNNTVESMQLIYAGLILDDALPLTHYNISESKFIVLMNKKITAPASAEESQPETQQQQTVPQQQQPQGQTAPLAAAPVDAPPAAVDEQRVRDLIGMGYEEHEVRAALRASFNHPERAIEYLITGLPPANDRTLASSNTAAQPGAEGDLVTETAERLHYLATDPRFTHVRNLIRQNPELLELVLAHLSESDPVTFEAIRSHQQEFISMLNEANTTNLSLPLSTDEEAAIERLMGLGFERDIVVQVYLACNKNEELAADMLFSQSEDEDE